MNQFRKFSFAAMALLSFFGSPVMTAVELAQATSPAIDPNFCGNKHKNLVSLNRIVQGMSQVEVPEFIGVPTSRIEAFLLSQHPEIFNEYASAITQLQGTTVPGSKTSEQILAVIQESIKACFANGSFPFSQDERNLFNRVAQQQRFFMVRSTGVEDGAIANAGGNASIAYVEPTERAIAQAMGEVIASYFGMQSLKNRIGGGEKISSTEFCLPVLIQLLIGEAFDGSNDVRAIPVSGVAYTTNQSLSAPGCDIAEINAAYGHGEGVVANRVVADRYYVKPSRAKVGEVSICPMLYFKEERLVPHTENNQHTLIACQNNKDLAHKSALSEGQVKQLYAVLQKIETDYGQPMDVEFVVVDTTIYIVQARPAMHVTMKPSYIDFATVTKGTDISNPMQGNVIVPGKAEVLVITNPADVIITKTLDEADQMPASTSCKAVIVSTWASSLSHAAVNFKSYGTPCVMISDLAQAKKLIGQISATNPLIIDVQQRSLFTWGNTQKSYQGSIVVGWLEHPIDRTYSLWMDAGKALQIAANPLPQDGTLLQAMQDLKKATNSQQQKDLIAIIVERISHRFALSERRIQHFGALCDEDLKKVFPLYKHAFETLIAEFTASIEQNADRFELLFFHKMLEALLYQAADLQKTLGGYTGAYFLNELYAKQVVYMTKIKLGTSNLQFADFF